MRHKFIVIASATCSLVVGIFLVAPLSVHLNIFYMVWSPTMDEVFWQWPWTSNFHKLWNVPLKNLHSQKEKL